MGEWKGSKKYSYLRVYDCLFVHRFASFLDDLCRCISGSFSSLSDVFPSYIIIFLLPIHLFNVICPSILSSSFRAQFILIFFSFVRTWPTLILSSCFLLINCTLITQRSPRATWITLAYEPAKHGAPEEAVRKVPQNGSRKVACSDFVLIDGN